METRNRLVVIGLDGMSLSQAKFVCKKFSLNNLSTIVESTNTYAIYSELPELSPVNWTSFFTGVGPEKHGIFGFVDIDPISYKITITDFTRVKHKTIFDELGHKKLISRVINLPNTYPAPCIHGVLISGFIARDFERSVYPKVYIPILREIGYKLEPDTIKGISDPEYLYMELKETLISKKKVIDLLWPDLAWDLFILIFTETDRINHFLYPSIYDKKNPLHPLCRNFFLKLDEVVGDLLDRFFSLPDPKRLMVVADHGFTSLITEVDLNVLLKNMGMLYLDKKPVSELDGFNISEKTRAFALDPGRIYIHKRGVFSRGKVTESDYKKIVEDIISCLKELEFKGQRVFDKIFLKDELYPGSKFITTPDILVIPKKGFDVKAKFDRKDIFGIYGRFGTHFREDVLFYDSDMVQKVRKVRDIGKEIIRHFSVFSAW